MIFLIIVLAGAAVWNLLYRSQSLPTEPKKSSAVTSSVCTKELIVESSALIRQYDITKLRAIEAQVRQLDNHKKDLNCNYILARYHVMINDQKNAQAYINTLSVQQADGAIYSRYFSPPAESPQQLQAALNTSIAEENDAGKKKIDEQNAAANRAADEAGGVE